MYDASDPVGKLASPVTLMGAAKPASPLTAYGATSYVKFYERTPDRTTTYSRSWLGRGRNFVVEYSEAEPGAEFERDAQPDEYVGTQPGLDEKSWRGGQKMSTNCTPRIIRCPNKSMTPTLT